MSHHAAALATAGAQVAAVRDDPAARLALMARVFRGPTGRAPRHLPFRRAAVVFLARPAAAGGRPPAPRRRRGRAVVARRAALAEVRWEPEGTPLVPGAQREHRGCIPGAPEPRRGGGRAGALLHERRAGACAVRALTGRGTAPGARTALPARPP